MAFIHLEFIFADTAKNAIKAIRNSCRLTCAKHASNTKATNKMQKENVNFILQILQFHVMRLHDNIHD